MVVLLCSLHCNALKCGDTVHLTGILNSCHFFLQVFEIEIREQAATAIWALAGQTLTQRKHMAKDIGYNLIIDLLLSSSDKMHYVGNLVIVIF